MTSFLPHIIHDHHFLLSANRTVFWEEQKALILSDLHVGKSGHFRKHGIGIPQNMLSEDMHRLFAEIQFYKPTRLIIVGDLFHSESNKEHELFLKWRQSVPHLTIDLVLGNHDILKKEKYEEAGIAVYKGSYNIDPFIFTHDICDLSEDDSSYCFSGHIHPGITIKGVGKQTLKFPCFYFNRQYAVLPAFGKFTGTHPIKPSVQDAVYALAGNSIIQVQ
ncbi:MAG: ligase-associated DNA damage response endonuclease PdeM [Chitinophagaceae bacterium]|nr:MAG: ligase-associated DNA damage response endonuclease PdeM [Chitinophagaceae bacterium]